VVESLKICRRICVSADNRDLHTAISGNASSILESKNRLKKVTPQPESTKPTSPAPRTDNTVAPPPTTTSPLEPARLAPTRRTESPAPPKTLPVLPPLKPLAGVKKPPNTASVTSGANASDRNSNRLTDTSPKRGAASPLNSREGSSQSPVRSALTTNKQPHVEQATRSASNAGDA